MVPHLGKPFFVVFTAYKAHPRASFAQRFSMFMLTVGSSKLYLSLPSCTWLQGIHEELVYALQGQRANFANLTQCSTFGPAMSLVSSILN